MGRGRRAWAAFACVLGLTACSSGGSPAGSPVATAPSVQDPRPNIIFVLTDDLSDNLIQYMPHVAAMEQEGTSFSNHYVVDSLCCPSRSAIFTGQYPHNDGVFTNEGADGGYGAFNRNGDATKSFGLALHRAGYRTGFMGKYLNEYHPRTDPPAPGWDEWDVAGFAYPEYDYDLNENGVPHHYGNTPQDYLTDVLSNKAQQFVDSSAASGQPFALEVATFSPHRPFTPAARDLRSFPTLSAPRGAAFDQIPTAPPRWLAGLGPLTARDEQQIDDWFRLRVEAVQSVDAMIGRIQRELVAEGIAQNTYFVFSSDNGYHMGEYRLRPGKQTAFDTDIRVPLVVTGPAVPAAARVDALTSSIDLAPTFEQIAGLEPPATADGTSLLSLWHGLPPPATWQQGVLVEHHGPDYAAGDPDIQPVDAGNPPSYEAVRTEDSLYVEYEDGDREYYDIAHDPDELHNLAAVASPARLGRLQSMLHALERCHGTGECQDAARNVPGAGGVGPVAGAPR